MSIQFELIDENIAQIKVSGVLKFDEFIAVQDACETAIKKLGKIKLLVLAEGFAGWEKGGKWEDTSFQERNDPFVEKFAVVVDEKWKDLVYIFSLKDLRKVSIEFFPAGAIDKARQWLLSES